MEHSPLSESQARMVAKWIPFVEKKLAKYRRHPEFDDLHSTVLLNVVQLASALPEGDQRQFLGYLKFKIPFFVAEFFRNGGKKQASRLGDSNDPLLTSNLTDHRGHEPTEEVDTLKATFERLPRRLAPLFSLLLAGKNRSEISQLLRLGFEEIDSQTEEIRESLGLTLKDVNPPSWTREEDESPERRLLPPDRRGLFFKQLQGHLHSLERRIKDSRARAERNTPEAIARREEKRRRREELTQKHHKRAELEQRALEIEDPLAAVGRPPKVFPRKLNDVQELASYFQLVKILHPHGLKCPRCGCRGYRRVQLGKKFIPLFCCVSCRRQFNAFSCTPLSWSTRYPSELLRVIRSISQGIPGKTLAAKLCRNPGEIGRLRSRLVRFLSRKSELIVAERAKGEREVEIQALMPTPPSSSKKYPKLKFPPETELWTKPKGSVPRRRSQEEEEAAVLELGKLSGTSPDCCPSCGASNPYPRARRLFYRECRSCRYTFTPLTRTPFATAHRSASECLFIMRGIQEGRTPLELAWDLDAPFCTMKTTVNCFTEWLEAHGLLKTTNSLSIS